MNYLVVINKSKYFLQALNEERFHTQEQPLGYIEQADERSENKTKVTYLTYLDTTFCCLLSKKSADPSLHIFLTPESRTTKHYICIFFKLFHRFKTSITSILGTSRGGSLNNMSCQIRLTSITTVGGKHQLFNITCFFLIV